MENEAVVTRSIGPNDPLAKERRTEWWGMIVFIFSEAIFFGSLISGYLYLRLQNPNWIPAGAPAPDLLVASVNTVLLVGSSVPIHFGRRAIRYGNHGVLNLGIILTILPGLAFLALQGWEYTHSGFTPQTGAYGAAFFTLTGFHGAHVAVGILFLGVLLARSLRGSFSAQHHFAVEAGTLYWHFVDAVWIALYGLLYVW